MPENIVCNFAFWPVTDWKGTVTDADGGTTQCDA